MNKFSHYGNKQLVNRINKRYSSNLNDDDEVLELCNRRDKGLLKFKVNFDNYELIEVKKWIKIK